MADAKKQQVTQSSRLDICTLIDEYHNNGELGKSDMIDWKTYAINGLLSKEDVISAIHKRQNGYPYYTFRFFDTIALTEGYDPPEVAAVPI